MSITKQIEKEFVETLGLLILASGFTADSEYQKGWLSGYAKAYTQLTGNSVYQLVNAANQSIEGSGKSLTIGRE